MREIGGVRPGDQVGGGEDANGEVLGVGDYHGPVVSIADYLRVAELGGAVVGRDHGVARVFGESIAAIDGIGNLLNLVGCCVESVDCDHSVRLIGEEAACVVAVDYDTAGEDLGTAVVREDGNWLVIPGNILAQIKVLVVFDLPMIEVTGCSMSPMLVASHSVCWIVYEFLSDTELVAEFG